MGKWNELCNSFWHNYNDLKNTVGQHTGIITGIGIVTALAGTIFACRATLKISEKAPEHKRLVEDTRANCIEAGMDEKHTKKEVMKAYRHVGADYVRKFWPAVGLLAAGYGLIVKAHCMEVAKNEALMSAYIGLQALFTKYRDKVAQEVGVEREQEIYLEAQVETAKDVDDYKGPFVEGSYLLFNDSLQDYEAGCPQANSFLIDTGQRELNNKFREGKRVYVNDVMRCFGHEEIAGGYQWCWYKGLTDEIDFKIHDPAYNPEFARGYGFDPQQEPIAKLYLIGCVHVSETYKAEYRRTDAADGGVIGGRIGRDPVIIG